MRLSAPTTCLPRACFLVLFCATSDAWTTPIIRSIHPRSTTTARFNVPPPSIEDAVAYKAYADRQAPPASFFELQQDSVKATKVALKDGLKLLEIEFPPVPANVLEMDDVSAYQITCANLNLAIDFAKGIIASTGADDGDANINKVSILFPDEAELGIATEKFLFGTQNPYPGVTVSALRRGDGSGPTNRAFKPLMSLLGGAFGGSVRPVNGTDMYVVLVASAQELPDIEELSQLDPGKPIVFYNLKLDILRGDLGAPAFPSKDFQDRFLSRVKPVYYLRTRQYSRSTPEPPFLVSFQGCLFRSYPGQFQTLLDTGTGRYRRVCGNDFRPPLGQFKEELTQSLRDEGVLKEEGETLNFLRTGYKVTTWWEEARPNASDDWKC